MPPGVPRGLLAPTALSKITLLVAQYRLSRREVKNLLSDFFDLKLCIGTISNVERIVSDSLTTYYDEIHTSLQSSPSVHADETHHAIA